MLELNNFRILLFIILLYWIVIFGNIRKIAKNCLFNLISFIKKLLLFPLTEMT